MPAKIDFTDVMTCCLHALTYNEFGDPQAGKEDREYRPCPSCSSVTKRTNIPRGGLVWDARYKVWRSPQIMELRTRRTTA